MAVMATYEGGDGVGKSVNAKLALDLLLSLKKGNVARLIPYTVFLADHPEIPSVGIITPEVYYQRYFSRYSKDTLFIVEIGEPSKVGIEGEARLHCLESWYSRHLPSLVFPHFYFYSRALTIGTLYHAFKFTQNIVAVCDRSVLTTEAMQPVDYLKEALKGLGENIGMDPVTCPLEEIIKEGIRRLGSLGDTFGYGEGNVEIKEALVRLAAIPQVRLILDEALDDKIFKEIIDLSDVWWEKETLKLREWRIRFNEGLQEIFPMVYPSYITVGDLPNPYEIGRARGLARYLLGGTFNFRDEEPSWAVDLISYLYRTVPRLYEGANVHFMNAYCTMTTMKLRAASILGEILFSEESSVRDWFFRNGYRGPGAIVTEALPFLRESSQPFPDDFEARLEEVERWTGLSLGAIRQMEGQGKCFVHAVADELVQLMGVPSIKEGQLKMRQVWKWHGISEEGRFVSSEGGAHSCEAGM